MSQRIVALIFFCTATFVFANNVRITRKSSNENFNSTDIMKQCNETYPIKTEYLQDLNDTGSFSDESEKVPMCYIHCYLNKMGVISQDNQVNKEKAVNMYQIEDEEMVDDCDKEMVSASISDPCGKAYYFIRCIMTRMMIDNKDHGDEEVKK
ncbi:unnamed protein product [Chironomus riparius]|uniref:Odorant binding protein n=1 Tax=Chironomus riparius TaxID=315576 RepID=A0A9N9RYQ1_9DIPT|nr:unnamed protein product [Chironomus riparius]